MANLGEPGVSLSDYGDGVTVDTQEIRAPGDIINETQYNVVTDALVKIQNVLGANVDGTFASVELRLADFLTRIVALEGGGIGNFTQENTVPITAQAGESSILIPNLAPVGAILKSVTMFISTSFGTSNGLTLLRLGDADISNRWGDNWAITNPTSTNASRFVGYNGGIPLDAPYTAILSTELGTFDSVGAANITAHYDIFSPSTT